MNNAYPAEERCQLFLAEAMVHELDEARVVETLEQAIDKGLALLRASVDEVAEVQGLDIHINCWEEFETFVRC